MITVYTSEFDDEFENEGKSGLFFTSKELAQKFYGQDHHICEILVHDKEPIGYTYYSLETVVFPDKLISETRRWQKIYYNLDTRDISGIVIPNSGGCGDKVSV